MDNLKGLQELIRGQHEFQVSMRGQLEIVSGAHERTS